MHNITRKTQDIVQQNLKFTGILSTGYNLSYTYADNSQQIANIADATYRADRSGGTYGTGKLAGDAVNDKMHRYSYDANGNMLYVGSGTRMSDSTMLENNSRKLLWDEENRLLAISDNGYVSNYWYDAAGERTVKQSGGSEGVFVNGVLSGARTETGRFTAYISPYMVVSNGGNYSKHIYMGSQRIVSKLSNSGIFAASPVTTIHQQARYTQQTNKIKERFDSLGVVYNGTPQTGGLLSSSPLSGDLGGYFYHPDHLGSSSLITDGTGALTQHIQYVPFGEVFVEERTTSWSTPYKFNGKELDEETGLYYYHARYYDPRLSVWMSVDPLAEKFPNISSYVYCSNNPVMRIDPDGRSDYHFNPGENTYSVVNTDKPNRYFVVQEFNVQTSEKSTAGFEISKEVKLYDIAGILNDNPGLFKRVYESAKSDKERSAIFNATVKAGKEEDAKFLLPLIFSPLLIPAAEMAAPFLISSSKIAILGSQIAADYTVYGTVKAALGAGKIYSILSYNYLTTIGLLETGSYIYVGGFIEGVLKRIIQHPNNEPHLINHPGFQMTSDLTSGSISIYIYFNETSKTKR